MGYSTDFSGVIDIQPPMDEKLIEFLTKFAETRRMNRSEGPDFVNGSGMMGQGRDPDIIDYNNPPKGQPGLWCNFIPSDDGSHIEWNGGEKTYNGAEWIDYIITRYIAPKGHVCNGVIDAAGEEAGDLWRIVVENNKTTTKVGEVVYRDKS